MKSEGNIYYILTFMVLVLGIWIGIQFGQRGEEDRVITVGFIYDNDETTPYSAAFMDAQESVQRMYQGYVKIMMYSNIMEDEFEVPLRSLIENKCDLIFTNSYGDVRTLAKKHPEIEFCQVSNDVYPESEAISNYHTFKGEIYQGRYLSGVVAGIKLKSLIDAGEITPEEAKVGFVAAFPYAEVISGYTAFILGIRSVVPEATMNVRYIRTWNNYAKEKACAESLLDEGCIIISQHTDTVGPAAACEGYTKHPAFHVGYNCDMTDVAPNTSLVSTVINWVPYVTEATGAVIKNRKIEQTVNGTVHPLNDMSAGFDKDWVRLTALNTVILPPDTQEKIDDQIEKMISGEIQVFHGDYRAVNPEDEEQWIDLTDEYVENEDSSVPSFQYILKDIITVEN